MLKTYAEDFLIRQSCADMGGTWRPSAVLEAMQETAATHCEHLGLGRKELDARGVAWVLSRTHVELDRLPAIGARVNVETYPLPLKHMFFPRVNTFRGETGAVIGRAASLWVLIDLETRRIVQDDYVLSRLPDNSDLDAPAVLPATVRPLPGEAREFELTAQYTEYDMNGHVNNARYLDWCCNALGLEALRERAIRAFDVNYDAEVRPGTILTASLTRVGDRFAFTGTAEGKRRFAVSGALAPREGR